LDGQRAESGATQGSPHALRRINSGGSVTGAALQRNLRLQSSPAMSLRRSIDIIPTHRWCIERSV
jgi:hypothetical protein